jgi:hypothetical protein
MPRPRPLPPALAATPFTSEDALRAGVTAGRLRARDLHHPFHGVHSSAAPLDVRQRCHAYLPLLAREASFSHETAAVLLGIPLPAAAHESPGDALHIPLPARRPVAGASSVTASRS